MGACLPLRRVLCAGLCFLCFLLCAVLLPGSVGLSQAFAAPAAGKSAGAHSADTLPPTSKPPLIIRPPSGFVDSLSIGEDLFADTRKNMDGELLKLFLPASDALLYSEKRRDAITRQVALYGWKDANTLVLDKKTMEMVAKTLEGAYASFRVIKEEDTKKTDIMAEHYRSAMVDAVSLLVDIHGSDHSITHVLLLNYPMNPESAGANQGKKPAGHGLKTPRNTESISQQGNLPLGAEQDMLSTALATTLVLINDSLLFISASSIIPQEEALTDPMAVEKHIEWVTDSAETFADMLVSANKK